MMAPNTLLDTYRLDSAKNEAEYWAEMINAAVSQNKYWTLKREKLEMEE